MRIQEEQERRKKEEQILERLPGALEEVHQELAACVERYVAAFGQEAAQIQMQNGKLRIVASEQKGGRWQNQSTVEVTVTPALPGFRIERAGQEPLEIEVGVLPGDKIYYRDQDKYLTLEDLSRKILDRALFPKLPE